MPPVVIDLRNSDDWRDVVHRAVQALAEGGLVAFPTETVYGLAASALDERAVCRLTAVKGRKSGKPLDVGHQERRRGPRLLPRYESVGLASRPAVLARSGHAWLSTDSHPDSLLRQLPEKVRAAVSPEQAIGLRVPGHQVVVDVLRMLAGPLVLSSANRSGSREAVAAQEVLDSFGDKLDLVVDDGPCRFGHPSTVVRVEGNRIEVLREGVVPKPTLRRLSSLMVLFVCTGNTCRSPMAEMLCRDMLAQRLGCEIDELEDRGVVVASAGIAAMLGGGATGEAVQCMSEMGLDLGGHETQPLTEPLVRHADADLHHDPLPPRGDRGPVAVGRRADQIAVVRRGRHCRPGRRARSRRYRQMCGEDPRRIENAANELELAEPNWIEPR